MSKVAVCVTVRFAASGRIFCPRFATSEQERRCTRAQRAPEGRGPGWPEFHAPSDVGVSTASVASTNLGQNLSAIIPQTGEISGLAAVFVFIMINNVNHTGLELPHPIFRLTNHWARKHDHHHGVNPRANYGSIFPFWDKIFGTYE